MLIAQFSDLHITHRGVVALELVASAERLRACIAALLAFNPRPDWLLLTGDLVDRGEAAEYAYLRELLRPIPIPMFAMPGNHDRRAPLRVAFSDHSYLGSEGPINFALEMEGFRILALDSLIEGEDAGELGPATCEWLCARLAEASNVPTLVAVHHPPLLFGVPIVDSMRLLDARVLGAIVAANPQIVAIVSGHIHRAMTARWNAVNVVVCPSTAHTLHLDLAPAGGMHYRLEPPAFCLHRWDGTTLTTHMVQAGDFAGPYKYY